MATGRKTGGRRRGTPNKATAKKAEEIAKSGLTPLDYMLRQLRNAKNPPELRMEAAKNAAPYVHPRLANVDARVDGIVTADVSIDPTPQFAAIIEQARRRRGTG